jgi:hypothetical protein
MGTSPSVDVNYKNWKVKSKTRGPIRGLGGKSYTRVNALDSSEFLNVAGGGDKHPAFQAP